MSQPILIGILNITPDSFSDGGNFMSVEKAVAQVKTMLAEGASIIDIGAESTRPGAVPLTHAEEWKRLEKILPRLANLAVPFSIDTRHPETAAKAIALGVHYINDVSGLQNSAMIEVVRTSSAKLIVMHNLGIPADKAVTLPTDEDPVELIKAWAQRRIMELEQQGIDRSRLIFDPGIGFGKTAEQSIEIIRRIQEFQTLGLPLYVGHSRKSFLQALSAGGTANRDLETAALSLFLARQGVQYLRVHNVGLNQKVLETYGTPQPIEPDYGWQRMWETLESPLFAESEVW